jgi:hypothetical protein
MIALHQISDQQCWAVEWVTPALTQLVSEARQNSSTRSGTVSSAAMLSIVGALFNQSFFRVASGSGASCLKMSLIVPWCWAPLANALSTSAFVSSGRDGGFEVRSAFYLPRSPP